MKREGDTLTVGYQALKDQLANVSTLSEEVKTLASKVKRIEEEIIVEPSTALSANLKKGLETSLAAFQQYFQQLGYEPKKGRIGVEVHAKVPGDAQYDGKKNRIILSQSGARDIDLAFHSYTHHVLNSFATEPFSQWDPVYQAIESGLADYFPCSFSGNPALAENFAKDVLKKPYIRNLENTRKFSELPPNPTVQDSGEIWGGAFWEMRQLLGKERGDSLLLSVWLATNPLDARGDPGANFVNELMQMAQSTGDKRAEQIKSIFVRRGLNV
jgi:hypothetical protein